MLSRFSLLMLLVCLACPARGAAEETEGLQAVTTRAEAGDSDAMYDLARMYRSGKGAAKDDDQGRAWCEKAAQAGNAQAMRMLGAIYSLAKDDAKALAWCEKAANGGDTGAMVFIGGRYEVGKGVAKDLGAALAWWEEAARRGSTSAMSSLAFHYLGRGDDGQVFAWWEKAARLDGSNAQSLGRMCEEGRGTVQSDAKAYVWHAVATALDNPESAQARDQVASRLSPAALATAQAEAATLLAEIRQAQAKAQAAERHPAHVAPANPPGSKVPLLDALVEQTELARITALIAAGSDANAVEKDSPPPIFTAARKGQAQVVTLLLAHGAMADSRLPNGLSLLGATAYEGREAVVELLLGRGVDAKATAAKGDTTALHFAALGGSTAVVRILLDHGAVVDARTSDGDTPLLWAVQNGHLDSVTLLLTRGADPKVVNHSGLTALHFAASYDAPQCIDLLLDRGLAVDARDQQGLTPLHAAARAERLEYTKVVTKEGDKPAVTTELPSRNKRHAPALLADGAIDPDTLGQVYTVTQQFRDDPKQPFTTTKTWDVAVYESLKSARRLIARGADVNLKDTAGKTPLAWTQPGDGGGQYAHEQVAALLREHGATE